MEVAECLLEGKVGGREGGTEGRMTLQTEMVAPPPLLVHTLAPVY